MSVNAISDGLEMSGVIIRLRSLMGLSQVNMALFFHLLYALEIR